MYVTRRSFCIVKNCQYHKLAFQMFRRTLLCFWTFCASLLVCFCYCFLTDSFSTTRKRFFDTSWKLYICRVAAIAKSTIVSIKKTKKKKRNNTTATLCWMHLSTMFLMHNMTSVSLVCLRSRSWERRIHGKFHVVVVRWRSKKPRNKNYATRAEAFLIFCCF